jgi:hypothetical protein
LNNPSIKNIKRVSRSTELFGAAVALQNCSARRLEYFLVLILRTSRDTTKLGFLKLGVLNVGIMNLDCFEAGCFGFGCVGPDCFGVRLDLSKKNLIKKPALNLDGICPNKNFNV